MKSEIELDPIGIMPTSSSLSSHTVTFNSESGGSIETVEGKLTTPRPRRNTASVILIPELLIEKENVKSKKNYYYVKNHNEETVNMASLL